MPGRHSRACMVLVECPKWELPKWERPKWELAKWEGTHSRECMVLIVVSAWLPRPSGYSEYSAYDSRLLVHGPKWERPKRERPKWESA